MKSIVEQAIAKDKRSHEVSASMSGASTLQDSCTWSSRVTEVTHSHVLPGAPMHGYLTSVASQRHVMLCTKPSYSRIATSRQQDLCQRRVISIAVYSYGFYSGWSSV